MALRAAPGSCGHLAVSLLAIQLSSHFGYLDKGIIVERTEAWAIVGEFMEKECAL
jgi:hypothetical protein